MSEFIEYRFKASDADITLCLRRYVGDGSEKTAKGKPVLLLHGGSGSYKTFTTPNGGLADWLRRGADCGKRFDPWLLDWRGSGEVVGHKENKASLRANGTAYNFNNAARYDLPEALGIMVKHLNKEDLKENIAVLGFCMGGGVVAESVAHGCLDELPVDRIVLMTLGLFYEVPIDGRLKSEDRVLERLTHQTDPAVLSVDPRVDATQKDLPLKAPWSTELEGLYTSWPDALKSHDEAPDAAPHADRAVLRMCNRMTFMYGMPYHEANLVKTIHGEPDGTGLLRELFGAIPLHMYIHGAQNIRQGHATLYNEPAGHEVFVNDEARAHFRRFESVSLIGGALDRLWHRDSIDRMHDWLCRGPSLYLHKFRNKRVFPNYAHQDLLWGVDSIEEVYPSILEGLAGDAPSAD